MELIKHIEVGAGGATSIVLDEILQTYDDLYLVCSLRSDYGGDDDSAFATINSVTTNQTVRILFGDGSSPGSVSQTRIRLGEATGSTVTANTFGNSATYIANYASTTQAKSFSTDAVTEENATDAYQFILAQLWNSTDAITSLELTPRFGSNWVQHSSATLYGIRKHNTAGAPKATGGIISYDSAKNKWVHTFTSSGTFTPTENLTNVEYLVIAGGGGGSKQGAGGGAGGYRCSVSGESSGGGAPAETPISLTASTGYTVTVGAGGVTGTPANQGSNSTFAGVVATGGGFGGAANTAFTSGGTGGSGGGGWGSSGLGGSPSTNQGFAGGSGDGTDPASAGGGGGASAVGANATSSTAGNGGAGLSSSITGSAIARAGGGGGGAVSTRTAGTASDGGGNGTNTNTGSAGSGLPATGGGGGGSGYVQGQPNTSTGGNGGSGVVIVRYAA